MHRTEGDGHVSNLFDPGDPFIPTPATLVTADWANAVQEELALAIEGLGGTLATAATDTTPNQLLTRLNAKFGRLDLVNSWAAKQTLNGGAVVNGAGTGAGVTSTGGPSGGATAYGLSATGGSGAVGVLAVGGANARGLSATGTGTGEGAIITGGAAADGMTVSTPATNGTALKSTGGPGGSGGLFAPGTAATAGTPQSALRLFNGYLVFDPGTTSPASTTAIKDAVTPRNIIKASATITTDGVGGVTMSDGFNVTGVAISGNYVELTLAQDFASALYQAAYGFDYGYSAGWLNPVTKTKAAGVLTIALIQGTFVEAGAGAVVSRFDVIVTGLQ